MSRYLQTTNSNWYVLSPMTLIDPEGQFRKYMHSLLFSSLIKSRQSDKICRRPCVTFKGHFRYYKRFHCLYIKYTTYVWGQLQHCHMSYASNYFYCLIQPECLNLIVIAKFLVTTPWATKMCRWIFVHNFEKCWLILKILSLLDSAVNLQQGVWHISHRTLNVSLHYFVKYKKNYSNSIDIFNSMFQNISTVLESY